jgi:hypothetical protein
MCTKSPLVTYTKKKVKLQKNVIKNITFCYFCIGHIKSYFDLKNYTCNYEDNMYIWIFLLLLNYEIAIFFVLKKPDLPRHGFHFCKMRLLEYWYRLDVYLIQNGYTYFIIVSTN